MVGLAWLVDGTVDDDDGWHSANRVGHWSEAKRKYKTQISVICIIMYICIHTETLKREMYVYMYAFCFY